MQRTNDLIANAVAPFRTLRTEGLAVCALLMLIGIASPTAAAVTYFHVATNGLDSNSGTLAAPFKTLAKARDTVRTVNQSMSDDIVVYVRGGTHRLTNTLQLVENATTHDSGYNGRTVIWKAYPGETPVVSGGAVITGWSLYDAPKNIWRAYVGTNLNTRQLFVGGQRAIRARGPDNPSGFTKTATGYTVSGATTNMQFWGNKSDIEFVDGQDWHHYRCGVSTIVGNAITMKQPAWGGCQFHSTPWDWSMKEPDWVENAYELLDAEREWYLNRSTGHLYYKPGAGENLATTEVVAPVLELLVTGIGTTNSFLHNLRFEGLTFADSTWLEPSGNYGYPSMQAGYYFISNNWIAAQMYAAVDMAYVRGIHFERNVFKRLGGAGLAIGGEWRTGLPMHAGATNVAVIGNVFTDIAGTGVAVGHGSQSLGYTTAHEYQRTRDVLVANNYVTAVGREYQDCVGIYVGHGDGVRLLHNEVHEVPYSGISVGWGWGLTSSPYAGRNEIGWNHVYRTLLSRRDGGTIYTLDKQPGSTIHHNYLHDQVNDWAALYLDEGTRLYTVTSNVVAAAPRWLYIWTSSIQSNTVMYNYSTTSVMLNNGLYNTIANNQTGLSSWPADAQAIITNAGLEAAYQDIKLTPFTGTYTNGFVWDRSVDFDSGANPNTDGLGNGVWNLRYATGGDLIAAGETVNNWWKQTGTSLILDPSWFGGGLVTWARANDSCPDISAGYLELGLNAAQAPLARWVNPAGTGVTVRIDGTVTKNGDNTTYAYDYVLAVRDVSAGTWSYLTRTNLPGTATSVASYNNVQVNLDANDEIVMGFKSSATMSGWYQIYDSITFTLLAGGGVTTTTTSTSSTTSSTTTSTTSSTTTTATAGGGVYTNGFVWDRSVDFDSSANPNTDSAGNGVWNLRYATGGDLISAGETAINWWKQTGTALVLDLSWFGSGWITWARANDACPDISMTYLELGLNAAQAPLARWVNPAGNGITLRIDGAVTKGGDNTTHAYDYVLAVRDVSAGTWSYITKTNLPGAATSVASYTNLQVSLDANDEIVMGFKSVSTTTGWYQIYDNITFTLVAGGGATTTTTTSSTTSSTSSTTTSTSSSTTTSTTSSSTTTTPAGGGVYTNGFLWDRSVDFDSLANPNTDSASNGVWHLRYATGGDLIAAGETANNWWKQTGTALVLDSSWFGSGFVTWARANDACPDISFSYLELGLNAAQAPLARWVNPAGNGITLRIDGAVTKGGDNTTYAYDYVLAVRDVSAGTWSYITRTNLPGTATSVASYTNVQVTLDANDEIVMGFKSVSTMGGWYQIYDNITFAIVTGGATTTSTTTSTSSTTTSTTSSTTTATYSSGFVWDRYLDFDEGGFNPNTDAASNGVWHLRHTYGGDYVSAGETTNNWWKQAGTAMTWDTQWWSDPYGVWARGNNLLPCAKWTDIEIGLGTGAERAALVRWVNPAGNGVTVSLGGVMTKGGSGYTAYSYDFVLAIHDVSANTWSYLTRTNLAGTVANVDVYLDEPVDLDANDEIIWGFRATGNIPSGQWYSLDDNVSITLE